MPAADPATLKAARQTVSDLLELTLWAADKQYSWLLDHHSFDGRLPRTFVKGELVTVETSDWTSGFFPGSLWYLYEATGKDTWRSAATRYTALLEAEQFNCSNHDVGFMLNCSCGNGLRLTGEPAYRRILLNGAKSLSSRFKPSVGCIMSWDPHNGWEYPVIIDNMMNLELLLWAARSGMPELHAIAERHADTTLRNHFRTDGSSFHVIDYDAASGAVRARQTFQGAGDSSAWSRGQAWGLYGFTMMYRGTGQLAYLEHARKIAGFIIHHPRMPADLIPYWDFDVPGIPNAPRDSSAAAIMCSALFELARFVDGPEREKYQTFALQQLRSLAGPDYFAKVGENGGFLLRHATGALPLSIELDVPLNYADYYFLEALLRAQTLLATSEGQEAGIATASLA